MFWLSIWMREAAPARQADRADDLHTIRVRRSRRPVSSQLPPVSAARSTITDPVLMPAHHRG